MTLWNVTAPEESRTTAGSGPSRTSSRCCGCSASRRSSGCCWARTEPLAAGILLAVLGATDWVDGYIARHFDQGSELGKILDPIADRVLLIAGAVGAAHQRRRRRSGSAILVLAREVVLSVVTLIAGRARAPGASMCSGSGKRARWR